MVRKLNNLLSTPFMIIYTCSLLSLISSFTTVLDLRESSPDIVTNYVTFFVIEPIKLVTITLYAAKIPEFFIDVKLQVARSIDKADKKLSRNTDVFVMLKRIEDKEIVYLTAGNIF
ncbi:hypothetical protein JTE90_010628 [Oedothorax gibbosus]|uniref:Uncharacterized protein n=1 Tax=Oedothorax gibbosus TaxID=931172 RepID=A0AAV6VG29_9ARAC|nr:hypothetical protein JTE90_010628 [Oedothorax gibbosus]